MSALTADLWPYVVLVLVGFLPNEIWRVLGVVAARRLDEDSEVLVWVRAVATAVLAAVIAKLTIFSPGALASIPLAIRLLAVASGFAGYYPDPPLGFCRGDRRRSRADRRRAVIGQVNTRYSSAPSRAIARWMPSVSGFSFSLAGGFIATPSLRGMTWTCRWKTTCPPALSLNCWIVTPSAPNAVFDALAIFCAILAA